MYFVAMAGKRLVGLLPVMEVTGFLGRKRAVSLPFTDWCPPLVSEGLTARDLVLEGIRQTGARSWRYLECRGLASETGEVTPSLRFYAHVLNLRRSEKELFAALKSRVRTPIRRARDAGVTICFETSLEAVREFYRLHCQTRRKHGVPPQPFRFFANIQRHALTNRLGWVALARWQGRTVAAGVFLHFGKHVIYKFGASDPNLRHLNCNHLLVWEAIRRYREDAFHSLDFGRTSLLNHGLRQFKLGFGPQESQLAYCKFNFRYNRFLVDHDRSEGWHQAVFRSLPPFLLRLVGCVLYRYLA
jgi:hypothetical protein